MSVPCSDMYVPFCPFSSMCIGFQMRGNLSRENFPGDLHHLMAPTPTQRRGGACGLDSVAQDNPAGSLDAHGDRLRWPPLQWSRAEWYNPDGPGVGRPVA